MSPEPSATYAVIGAGPSGLAAARNLDRVGLGWSGYELADDVGGLWNIDGPRSTMYDSAHLISSRTTTEFTEFPMPASVADYPSHRDLFAYFRAYADAFDLRSRYAFGTEVVAVRPAPAGGWDLTVRDGDGEHVRHHAGVLVANGTLSEPAVPHFAGIEDFEAAGGTVLHTSAYRSPDVFRDARVLVIGAGNSGCDIAVDAVHRATSVDISVRRGYHFVPKWVLGRPIDTFDNGRPLPPRVKQAIDARVVRAFAGDPTRFGLPAPDHRIYESHPVVNSLVLHHLGQGDLTVRRDVERFSADGVVFRDGERAAYDVVVLATGYRLHYPFLDPALLGWDGPDSGTAPDLYLNIVPRGHRDLFVLGMVEASGIGWQGRFEQAELVASYLAARASSTAQDAAAVAAFDARADGPRPDLSGGYSYVSLARMAYYVNKHAYRRAVRAEVAALHGEAPAQTVRGAVAGAVRKAVRRGVRRNVRRGDEA